MNLKALLIDRRSIERNELALPLKKLGVRKVVEVNVQELTNQPFQAGQYDAVFIEFHTLMESGRGLAVSLREMDPNVPIIVTYPPETRITDLKKYCPQASAYLVSPFTGEQLRATIEQCLSASTTS